MGIAEGLRRLAWIRWIRIDEVGITVRQVHHEKVGFESYPSNVHQRLSEVGLHFQPWPGQMRPRKGAHCDSNLQRCVCLGVTFEAPPVSPAWVMAAIFSLFSTLVFPLCRSQRGRMPQNLDPLFRRFKYYEGGIMSTFLM